jgi:prepilin-type N-terminal cleavage/methylation domain-containing protein
LKPKKIGFVNRRIDQPTKFTIRRATAFTLIELLVVILIIAVLIGLAFPTFQGVQNSARRTQAKNDLVQIVTAVNAFYTEYGRYPTAETTDVAYGPDGADGNDVVLNELRAIGTPTLNTRKIQFISPPDAKDQTNPRGGIKTADGEWYDVWGITYAIKIDANYDNGVANPYSTGAGATTISQGVIAWSFGKDKASTSLPGPAADKSAGTAKDDVISWQ